MTVTGEAPSTALGVDLLWSENISGESILMDGGRAPFLTILRGVAAHLS